MNKDMVKVGRVAIRHEGEFINAYWAQPDAMENATLLGSMRYALVAADNDVFEAFKELMQFAAQIFLKTALNADAKFGNEEPAPEHERSGHA